VRPDKKLGQNFLTDSTIADEIVLHTSSDKQDFVLEIGPGPGMLTQSILALDRAKKIVAVEMDPRCVTALSSLVATSEGRLTVIQGDALRIDEEKILQEYGKGASKIKVIANLPYNVGTELLIKWLKRSHLFSSITIMLQKEVVERICATPDTKKYGRLAVMSQLLCEVNEVIEVAPEYFFPPPKVTSAVVNLIPRAMPLYPCDLNKVERLTAELFNHRRKMIHKLLKPLISEECLNKTLINLTKRPEQLTLEEICLLSELIK
jgi:16S rRNA (adenine1518-N6/adenine1519-N6)-dimethyltransferase